MSTQHVWFWSAEHCSQQAWAGKNRRIFECWAELQDTHKFQAPDCCLYSNTFCISHTEQSKGSRLTRLLCLSLWIIGDKWYHGGRRAGQDRKATPEISKNSQVYTTSGCLYNVYCLKTWISTGFHFLNHFFPQIFFLFWQDYYPLTYHCLHIFSFTSILFLNCKH